MRDRHGWSAYLDGLCIELEAIFGDQELLNIFTLITLKLDHLAHFAVCDNSAIASFSCVSSPFPTLGSGFHIPNFFLITLRIFF